MVNWLKNVPYVSSKYRGATKLVYPDVVGSVMQQLAFAPSGMLIAIADAAPIHNNVIVYSSATTSSLTLAAGSRPSGCIWSPDGNSIYTANADPDNSVSRIAYPTGTKTDYPLGAPPSSLVVTPDNTLIFATMSTLNMMKRIVVSTGAVTNVGTGASPSHVAISRDGKVVAVSNFGDNNCSLIKVADSSVVNVATDTGPIAAAISPNCREAWIACALSNSITHIDLSSFLTSSISLAGAFPGYFPVNTVISPDGSALYVLSVDPTFTFGVTLVLNTQTKVSQAFANGSLTSYLDVHPRGSILAVAQPTSLFTVDCYATPL